MAEEQRLNRNPPVIGASVIPIIDKVRDTIAPFREELSAIALPQVAVVGSQSSGKSSVLEALVGRDFLPRGCDICTRRPLVLMLENCPEGDDGREWGEFLHSPGRIYDFAEIRREIQVETERLAGSNKGVSDEPIRLKISSPNVLNMTLVDLPGITRIPVGDQPSDIESQIRSMIMSYIIQENCIILAVSPANLDLATSDALSLAREADPSGSRTVGVITKLDIMDKGTDARNFLLGKVVPLQLGYFGIKNRCQEDVNKNRSIIEALADEEQYFRANPAYQGLSDCCGIPQLAKKLSQILEQHIKNVLPGLRAQLTSRMSAIQAELRTYGEAVESRAAQGHILLNLLTRYSDAFSALIDGKSKGMPTKELCGGARIHYIFQSIFVKSLEDVDPCEGLSNEDIRTAIQNTTGPRNALFVPEAPFEVLVKFQIARLKDPSHQCVQFVYHELLKISRACEPIEMRRFPILRRLLAEVTGKFLRNGVVPAKNLIETVINLEMDYINSSHPRFIGGKKAVELARDQLKASPVSSNNLEEQNAGQDIERSASERGQQSRAAHIKSVASAFLPIQVGRSQTSNGRPDSVGNSSSKTWGFTSIFGSRTSFGESTASRSLVEAADDTVDMPDVIHLREPPSILKPREHQTDDEAVEIIVTKLLLRSYYDIVRKNMQDLVPKAVMHFLVNHAKRELHNTFIRELFRENIFDELLQEHDEIVMQRRHTQEMFHVLEQSLQALEEIEFEGSPQHSVLAEDTAYGVSRAQGHSSSPYSTAASCNIASNTAPVSDPRTGKI